MLDSDELVVMRQRLDQALARSRVALLVAIAAVFAAFTGILWAAKSNSDHSAILDLRRSGSASLHDRKAAVSDPTHIHQSIRARQIELLSSDGRTLLMLGEMAGTTGFVAILDKNGTRTIELAGDHDGGSLTIRHKSGNRVVQASATSDGGTLYTFGKSEPAQNYCGLGASHGGGGIALVIENKLSAMLHGSSQDGGSLTVFNNEGRQAGLIAPTPEGHGSVSTYNAAGHKIVTLNASSEGIGLLQTADNTGQPIVLLNATTNGSGAVHVSSHVGGTLVTLYEDENGNGALGTYNPRGKELVGITSQQDGGGLIKVSDHQSKGRVQISTQEGYGTITTFSPNATPLAVISGGDLGGGISIFNKTSERVVNMSSNIKGFGFVSVFDRYGAGQVFQPEQ